MRLTKAIVACAFFSVCSVSPVSAQTPNVSVGAIRWDAWYGQRTEPTPGFYACRALSPRAYHFRAPWFVKVQEPDKLLCDGGDQQTMDSEIAYAQKAMIKYWAFVWYKPDSPMLNGWKLYQASEHKTDVDWSIIAGYGQFHLDMTRANGYSSPEEYAKFFAQPTFQKVLGGRPLLYLFRNEEAPTSQLKDDVSALRAAADRAGISSPYVVIMFGNASLAVADAKAVGADAISAYAATTKPHGDQRAFVGLKQYVAGFWNDMAGTGKPAVPVIMAGWDTRPQYDNELPWNRGQKTKPNFYNTATAAEVGSEVASAVSWVRAHSADAPAQVAIIYAWNEFTEGGWICPTFTDHGPDTSRLDAIGKVLRNGSH
jgi:hypothetical protein